MTLTQCQQDYDALKAHRRMCENNLHYFSGIELYRFNVEHLRESLRREIETTEQRMQNIRNLYPEVERIIRPVILRLMTLKLSQS